MRVSLIFLLSLVLIGINRGTIALLILAAQEDIDLNIGGGGGLGFSGLRKKKKDRDLYINFFIMYPLPQ